MKKRNRVIYANEGVFAGPAFKEGELYSENIHSPNLSKIQSLTYNININRQQYNTLGRAAPASKQHSTHPNVSLEFTYNSASATNEKLLGLGYDSVDNSFLKNIIDVNDTVNYRKNFYVVSMREGIDFVSGSGADMESVLFFSDCALKSYSYDIAVNQFPNVSVSFEGDNMGYFKASEGSIYTSDWGIVSAPGDHGWTNIRVGFDYMGSPDYAQFYATTEDNSHYMYQNFTEITAGRKYRIKGSVYIPSTNPKGDGVVIYQGASNVLIGHENAVSLGITNQWVEFDVIFTAQDIDNVNRIYIYGIDSSASNAFLWAGSPSSSYDLFRFGNIVITEMPFQSLKIPILNKKTAFEEEYTEVDIPQGEKVDEQILIPAEASISITKASDAVANNLPDKIRGLSMWLTADSLEIPTISVYVSDFEDTTNPWTAVGSVSSTPGRAQLDGYWSMAMDGSGSSYHYLAYDAIFTPNKKYKLTGKAKIPSSVANLDRVIIFDYRQDPNAGGSGYELFSTTVKGEWVSFEKEFTADEYTDHLEIRGMSGGSSTWTAAASDEFFVRDIVVTEVPIVTEWKDKTGNVTFTTAGDSSNTPELLEDIYIADAADWVHFEPSENMVSSSTLGDIISSNGYTVFILYLHRDGAVPVQNACDGATTLAASNWGHQIRKSSGNVTYEQFYNASNGSCPVVNTTIANVNLMMASYDGSVSKVYPRRIGPLFAAGADFVYAEEPLSGVTDLTTTLTLGDNGFDGDIAEVIVYRRNLAESEKFHVQKYLYDKYGLWDWSWDTNNGPTRPLDFAGSDFVDFQNDKLQALKFSLNLERLSEDIVGHRIPLDKSVKFPIPVESSLTFLVDASEEGSLATFISRDEKYDVSAAFKRLAPPSHIYSSTFYQGFVDGWEPNGGTILASNYDGGYLQYDASTSTGDHRIEKELLSVGSKYKISGEVWIDINSQNITGLQVMQWEFLVGDHTIFETTATGGWVSFSAEFTSYDTWLLVRALKGDQSSFTTNSSDNFYIRNFEIDEVDINNEILNIKFKNAYLTSSSSTTDIGANKQINLSAKTFIDPNDETTGLGFSGIFTSSS